MKKILMLLLAVSFLNLPVAFSGSADDAMKSINRQMLDAKQAHEEAVSALDPNAPDYQAALEQKGVEYQAQVADLEKQLMDLFATLS